MSFTTVRDALIGVVESVTDIKAVLAYEPDAIEIHPLAWVLLDSYTRSWAAAGVTSMKNRFMVRIVSNIQQSKAAEDELVHLAQEVADAIDRNPQFSGAITSGLAQSPDGRFGWIVVNNVKCRVADVFVQAMDKYTI